MVQFGYHLKAARLESGLTQADVASRLGVSKGYISRLESGKARPAEATVRRLAELCATDPDRSSSWPITCPPTFEKFYRSTPLRRRRSCAAPLAY